MYIFEPQWGIAILQGLNARVSSSHIIFAVTSFLADSVVFLFPVFLIGLYGWGMRYHWRARHPFVQGNGDAAEKNKFVDHNTLGKVDASLQGVEQVENTAKYYKIKALRVFSATVGAVCINVVLQEYITKARPETVLSGVHHLLLKHLPTMSFPSDHAAASMAFAMAILFGPKVFRGIKKLFTHRKSLDTEANNSYLSHTVVAWGWVFLVAGIVMSVARVAVGVHWPTDIITGWLVGCIATYIVYAIPQRFFLRGVKAEECVTKRLASMVCRS